MRPHYLSMIIPARWYAGGKGLDSFRSNMLNQCHIRELVDIANSLDCFPGVNVAGGVCYFVWDLCHKGDCLIKNMKKGNIVSEMKRSLSEFDYFVRENNAVSIIRKVLNNEPSTMDKHVFSRNYFGVATTDNGDEHPSVGKIRVLTSKGVTYIKENHVLDRDNVLKKYKVVVTYAMSGGNKPTTEGNYQIISSLQVLAPNEACSETYLILDTFDDMVSAEHLKQYVSGKFARFLLLQALTSIHITKDKFCFVPLQDFSKPWTDAELYKKYGLTQEEINFIESMIKPMDGGGADE